MKALLFTLFCASLSFAKPVTIDGTWEKTKNVLPLARVHYVVMESQSELEQFKQLGYTCEQIQNHEVCRKVANKGFELPIEVKARLWEMAYDSVSFSRSSDDYSLSKSKENLKEWSKYQSVEIDKLRFEKLYWREQSDEFGTITKIVLESNRHDEKVDLMYLNPENLGVIVKLKVGNLRGWNEYWGVVQFKR